MARRQRKAIAETGLTDHELRVLRYLDQRGPRDRQAVVADLSSPESRIGARRDAYGGRNAIRGSNGAAPLIMAAWCGRLEREGLVRQNRDPGYGQYRSHEITPAGRQLLRTVPSAG